MNNREPKPGSDDVRALIAEARSIAIIGNAFAKPKTADLLRRLADALESASTRPAGAVPLDVLRKIAADWRTAATSEWNVKNHPQVAATYEDCVQDLERVLGSVSPAGGK